MKNHWITALLCLAFAFVATGCGTPREGGNKNRRYTTAQTGTNIPRWQSDAGSSRAKQRTAKAKREKTTTKKPKAEKPKREEGRTRSSEEEVITRGGFR